MKIIKTGFEHNNFKAYSPSTNNQQNKKSDNITGPLEKLPVKDTYEISVGYVNDAHGQTNNMLRILSGLEGDLVLSAGDNDIGDEKNKAVHKATFKFLNLGKIIATALGNHEMDTTQADLIDSLKDYNGDILTINMKKDLIENQDKEEVKNLGRADLLNYLKPSKIVEVKGEKIGLLGTAPIDLLDRLTHPTYHTDCHVDKLDDSIKDIQEEVNKLKEQGINKSILL